MLVKCIVDSGKKLPKECIALGYTSDSKIDLVLEEKYVVYGICLWRGKLHYLVYDECETSSWYPCLIFALEDNKMPDIWRFRFINDADKYSVQAVFGYPELVDSESHFDDLMERDGQALAIFSKRRHEIDQLSLT